MKALYNYLADVLSIATKKYRLFDFLLEPVALLNNKDPQPVRISCPLIMGAVIIYAACFFYRVQ